MPKPERSGLVLAGGLALAGLATVMGFAARRRFAGRVRDLETRLAAGGSATTARTDLPDAVLALAKACGARGQSLGPTVTLTQSGQMWSAPGARPFAFTSRQTIATRRPGFLWRATAGPLGSLTVLDYFVDGHGGLDITLFGALGLAGESGSGDIDQGEGLRFLAELPLNPDAILRNPDLVWREIDARTLAVALGQGEDRAEITFTLGDDGLVETAGAASRVYIDGGVRLRRPWRGRFWDYRLIEGRLLPTRAEVAWVLDQGDFVYWRGRVETWTAGETQ